MDALVPPVMSLRVSEPEALKEAIRDAHFRPCQISVRPLASSLDRVACSNVCLDFADFGPAMLFSGPMPCDCYTLVFVTACPAKGRSFNFSIEHTDGYMGFYPPGAVLDGYTPEGFASATLTVPSAVFLAAVGKSFPEIPEAVLKRGAGMRIGPVEQAVLRALLSAVKECIEDPAEPLAGKVARVHLEKALLDAFMCAVRSGSVSLVPRPGRRVEARMRRLRQAREYVAGFLHEPIQLEDLCGSVGLSRRGVEMLFQDSLGIGPVAFIRHQRLHGARRALLSSSPAPGVVKKIALDWGFWHLGRFSITYRALFGESPNMTLTRMSRL